MKTRKSTAIISSIAALACALGCSKEKMKEAFDKGVEHVGQTVAKTTDHGVNGDSHEWHCRV